MGASHFSAKTFVGRAEVEEATWAPARRSSISAREISEDMRDDDRPTGAAMKAVPRMKGDG